MLESKTVYSATAFLLTLRRTWFSWNLIDFQWLDSLSVLKSVSFGDFRGFYRKSEGVLSTQNQLYPDMQFAREQTLGFLMIFIDFPSFWHTFCEKSVSFCDFRVFEGALPCSAQCKTRPLQYCVLRFTRFLHVLPQTGFFCKTQQHTILISIYISNFPLLIPMHGPRKHWFYKRLR